MPAIARIEPQLRTIIRERRLDPIADRATIAGLVSDLVADDDGLTAAIGDERELSRSVRLTVERRLVESVAGFGPLQHYLDDPTVEEVWINERLAGGSDSAAPEHAVTGLLARLMFGTLYPGGFGDRDRVDESKPWGTRSLVSWTFVVNSM